MEEKLRDEREWTIVVNQLISWSSILLVSDYRIKIYGSQLFKLCNDLYNLTTILENKVIHLNFSKEYIL